MDERSAVFMFKSIAMRFDSILMMDFKPLPMPTVVQCSFIVHHPGDVLEHAVQGARKSQLTELREAFFDKRCPHNLERSQPFSVGDVFSLEEKEWKTEDMVSVDVGNEHRLNGGHINALSAKASECSGGGVDDVVLAEECKGVVPSVGKKGVARP